MKAFSVMLQKHMKSNTIIKEDLDNDFFEDLHMPPVLNKENNKQIRKCNYWRQIYASEKTTLQANFVNIYIYQFIENCLEKCCSINDFNEISYFKLHEYEKITSNMFLQQPTEKHQLVDIFCKAQRTYWAFARFVRRIKFKKATLQIAHDLYLNPIPNNVPSMIILDGKSKYLFKLSDLINIVNSALSHSVYFFGEPMYPKNPYTNIEFSSATLFEIYHRVKRSDFKMPVLLHYFFLSEFDIDDFFYNYEATIRDIHIEDHVKKAPSETLYPDVKLMIRLFDRKRKMRIDKEFPKDKFVDIMRPYLRLYYMSEYTLSDTSKKLESYTKLLNKMNSFVEYNPQFGRTIMRRIPGTQNFVREFNDKHINFYEESNNMQVIFDDPDTSSDDDEDDE
jgi:hypothetical protein